MMRALVSAATALVLVATPVAAQTLYWVDTNHGAPVLRRADADGFVQTSLALPAGSLPEGLAVDGAGRVYWGEAAWTDAKIRTAGGFLTDPATVIGGGSVIRGVAVDAAAQQVYWTTSNLVSGATLRRAPTGGGPAVTLLSLGAGANPRGVAIDAAGGKVYWADFDQDVVYRANLDGGGLTAWMTLTAGSGPWGVAFDAANQRVWWSEYNTGLTRYASTSGAGVTTRASGLSQPTYLALDPDAMRYYVIESGVGQQAIRRHSMYGGGGGPIALVSVQSYGGLAFAPSSTVSVPEPAVAVPLEFALEGPRPNPAAGVVRIPFALPREASFRLAVYDVRGREVAELAAGTLPAGRHDAWWDPHAAAEARPAGIYFARLVADGRTWTQRVVFVR